MKQPCCSENNWSNLDVFMQNVLKKYEKDWHVKPEVFSKYIFTDKIVRKYSIAFLTEI